VTAAEEEAMGEFERQWSKLLNLVHAPSSRFRMEVELATVREERSVWTKGKIYVYIYTSICIHIQ
jgi:hypothetical protein